MPDQTTLEAYERHAPDLARSYAEGSQSYIERLKQFLPGRMRVIDVGAGTGIELSSLLRAGHDALGLEPSAAMRAAALADHPELEGRLLPGVLPGGLPEGKELADLGGAFDAVACSAVLQHLPQAELFNSVLAIRCLLKVGGRAIVSIPSERSDLDASGRDPLARLYHQVSPTQLAQLFEHAGFELLHKLESKDSLGRGGIAWITLVFELQPEGSP